MHAQHAQRVWRPPGIHLAFIDRADDNSTDDDPRESERDGTGGVVPKTRQASGKADGGGFDSFA